MPLGHHFKANDPKTFDWHAQSLSKVQRTATNGTAKHANGGGPADGHPQRRSAEQEYDSDDECVPPHFVSELPATASFQANSRAHLECMMDPALLSDDTLQTRWTHNGQEISSNNRIITATSPFGTHTLEVLGVRPTDAGVYECHISSSKANAQAQTRCTVQVYLWYKPYFYQYAAGGEQQPTNSPGEDMSTGSRFISETINEDQSTAAPKFTEVFQPEIHLEEGEPFRLQATVQPVDSLMRVEWTRDGKPLSAGSRLSTFYDFGLATMSILDTREDDSALYICRATNRLGTAETSCKLTCLRRGKSTMKPSFQQALAITPSDSLQEAEFAHFETRLEPRADPHIHIEWLFNSRPIQIGQRVIPHYDFGVATLDVTTVYPEDVGKWTVRATNSLGTDEQSVELKAVQPKKAIQDDIQHPAMNAKIAELEYRDFSRTYVYNDESAHEPRIVQGLDAVGAPKEMDEGTDLLYTVSVEPKNDPNMKVEFLLNNQTIHSGQRVRAKFDFGVATLHISSTQPRDSGDYVVRFSNPLGKAETTTTLLVHKRASVITDVQNEASLQRIRELESYENATGFVGEQIQEKLSTESPKFVQPLEKPGELREHQSLHLEAVIQPPNDPTTKVEWYVNGKPLPASNRFKTTYDFGVIMLDMLYVIAEDSGEYTLRVRNDCGEVSETISISVKARSSIISDAVTMNYHKIQELEDMLNYKPKDTDEVKTHDAPSFPTALHGPEKKVKENATVHFECTVYPANDPKLKIEWFKDSKPLVQSSRFRFTHDLDYVALEILGAAFRDEGEYTVKATNEAGEAASNCSIKCANKRDVVIESLNPRALRKIQELESWNI